MLLSLLPEGADAAPILTGDINKPKTLVLNQFHVPIADQTLEKPTDFSLLSQLQALRTILVLWSSLCILEKERL